VGKEEEETARCVNVHGCNEAKRERLLLPGALWLSSRYMTFSSQPQTGGWGYRDTRVNDVHFFDFHFWLGLWLILTSEAMASHHGQTDDASCSLSASVIQGPAWARYIYVISISDVCCIPRYIVSCVNYALTSYRFLSVRYRLR
jgi:hypothetical protein